MHRLDRTTSGVMLVAKTQDAYTHLKKEFKERRVEKTYRAIVYGHMEAGAGSVVAEICRSSEPPKFWYAESCSQENPRAAITDWRVLSRGVDSTSGEKYTTLSITPKTGRTHQIRVHMAFIGHPLIADHLYGKNLVSILGFTRPALHAESISVVMPSGQRETWTAPIPQDFTP